MNPANAREQQVWDVAKRGDTAALAALLEQGLDPNQSAHSAAPLYAVLRWDRLDMLRLLLDAGADPNCPHKGGATPLMWARSGTAAQMLIEAGADPHARTPPGERQTLLGSSSTVLMAAAASGYADVVDELLAHGVDPALRDADGCTALMRAAFAEHQPVVERLLAASVSVDLVEAALLGDVERLRALLDIRSELPRDRVNRALWWSAGRGRTHVVQELLDSGADVDAADAGGMTALIHAARHGRTEMMRLLLERGANVHAKSDRGSNALLAYVTRTDSEQREGVALLIAHGAHVNAHGWTPYIDGWSPLMLASIHGAADIVELLLRHGADPNAFGDEEGAEEEGCSNSNALQLAATNGHVDVVRVLLQYGADPYTTDNAGDSAYTELERGGGRHDREVQRKEILELLQAPRQDDRGGPPVKIELRHRLTGEVLSVVKSPMLAHADLSGQVLAYVNLRDTSLRSTDLANADLTDADLSLSRLPYANLRGARLHRANLERAQLWQADLTDAALTEANLTHAEVFACKTGGADTRGVRLSFARVSHTDLSGKAFANVHWRHTALASVKFASADLSKARLRNCTFERCDLNGACLQEADLSNAIFRAVDFEGADFTGATLQQIIFVNCKNLHRASGLETIHFRPSRSFLGGPSSLDLATIRTSIAYLPTSFLVGLGYTEAEIDGLRRWKASLGG